MTAALRLVPHQTTASTSEDPALRPTSFADYIGQTEVITNLRGAVRAAKRGGWPRIANRLLRRVRDAAANAAADGALVWGGLEDLTCVNGTINGSRASAALTQLGIDHQGLDALDRRYLSIVAECPVGIEAICAELAEDRSTIEDAVEPFLMQVGFIKRGGKGRQATEAGRAHLSEVKVQ
jgi:Holliday junction DNA helicase RuvB